LKLKFQGIELNKFKEILERRVKRVEILVKGGRMSKGRQAEKPL